MKSPMIEQADYIKPEEKGLYSDLQVLQSAAGYYVGTTYQEPGGYQSPGSRDSGYFATAEEAALELAAIEAGIQTTRMRP